MVSTFGSQSRFLWLTRATIIIRRHLSWRKSLLTLTLFTLIFLYLMPRRPFTSNRRPTVRLRQGIVIGTTINDPAHPQVLEAFYGVPYGLSTAGSRRFLPPLSVGESDEEFDATEPGDQCPYGLGPNAKQSEDCLNADILRPMSKDGKGKLPVVIHFHGGAFNVGAGDSSQRLAGFVARAERGMVGVGFNYRVGALGFLAGKRMGSELLEGMNVGLRDQRLLLEWVRDNIEAFGGDSDCVTVMGSSAGAHSIGHHILHNPTERPLFHQAILESGSPTARSIYSYNNSLSEVQFKDLVRTLELHNKSDSLLSALRSIPTTEFKTASQSIFQNYNPSIRWPFQPVIEPSTSHDPIILFPPIFNLKMGNFHKIPILLGYNTNEGSMFVPKTLNTNSQFIKFFSELLPGLSDDDLRELVKLYPDPNTEPQSPYIEKRKGLGKQFMRTEQAYAQFAYIAPVRMFASFMAGGRPGVPSPSSESQPQISYRKRGEGGTEWQGPNVYLYHFAASSSLNGGADHGTQIPFVNYFPSLRARGGVVDETAGSMHAYWTSFILTGNPNAVKSGKWGGRMEWPKYKSDEGNGGGKLIVFGEGNDIVAGGEGQGVALQVKDDDFASKESEFWWRNVEKFEF